MSSSVILSIAGTSRSEAPVESKDPYPLSKNKTGDPKAARFISKELSLQHLHAVHMNLVSVHMSCNSHVMAVVVFQCVRIVDI